MEEGHLALETGIMQARDRRTAYGGDWKMHVAQQMKMPRKYITV